MNGYYGFVEIILVFGLVLAWGLYEWRSARRYKRDVEKDARAETDR